MKKNFESFDLWSQAKFALWSNIRYDFELIAEIALRYPGNSRLVLELLNIVNQCLKNQPQEVIFNGTIRNLKYLIKEGYLNLSNLPTFTSDEKYLVEVLTKYANRLDITEVYSDIEEPTLRAMLLEYPHLLSELFKERNPLANHEISKAFLKYDITDEKTLLEKVDNGLNSIEVDTDKNSIQAMKLKIIFLGLYVNNGKIKLVRDSHLITEFENLTNDTIEGGQYSKSAFNSLYVAIYSNNPWNKEMKGHLSGCETLYLDWQLLHLPDNHMSFIYNFLLKDEVDTIGKKYFGEEYSSDGFISSLAVKMAMLIVIFRSGDFIPEGEQESTHIFGKGVMLDGLNYGFEETEDKEHPLKAKEWFLNYFRTELGKRVAFIKMQVENGVAIYGFGGRHRVIYLPVFESFRFFCGKRGLVEQVISLLKNRNIPYEVRDEVLVNLVLNIQKIISDSRSSDEEKYYQDAFTLLIVETFEQLVKSIPKKLQGQSKKYYEEKDLIGDSLVAVLELIKDFDLSKSNSFIAYLISNLSLKVKSESRPKKADLLTGTEGMLGEDFFDNVPTAEEFMDELDKDSRIREISKYIDMLPEMQREAVRKVLEGNERLTESERRNKTRGLDKIREMMNKQG